MKLKHYMLALLAFGMALFLLSHFALIWVYGQFYVYESNYLILSAETVMMVGILVFSAHCAIEALKAPQQVKRRIAKKTHRLVMSDTDQSGSNERPTLAA